MRLFRASIALSFSLALVLVFTACGGSNTKANVASTITISSNNISLTKGEMLQLSPTASDSNGNIITVDFIYSTGNPNLITVTSTGLVCAGVWDAANTVCKPATTTGTTTITIAARNSTATLPVTAFVHEQVDSIQVTPPTPTLTDCISSAKTIQLQAKAFSNNPTVCGAAATPCELPKSSIGDFTWHSADTSVVTVDNATNPAGLATAQTSGAAKVFASLGTTNSPNANFFTCPIVSLQVTRKDTNDTSPFTLDVNGTKDFNAVAIDSKGVTLAAAPINWYSTNNYGISVAVGSTTITATATASKPATTTTISASCVSSCNRNLTPVWAAPIVATSNGASLGTVVYAASTQSTSVVPVDGTTVGTAFTLPRLPNSFLLTQLGTTGVLGSDEGGLMFLDTTTNTTTSLTSVSGAKVLAISTDGRYGAAANSTDLFILDVSGKTMLLDIKLAGITSFAFAPGSALGFAAKGTSVVYQVDAASGIFTPFATSGNVSGVATVVNGPIAYLSQPGIINVLPTCAPATSIDTQTAANPTLIESLPTAQGAVAVDMPNMVVVNSSNISQACPPSISNSRVAFDLGLGSATPAQLAVSPDSTKAVVTTNSAKVAVANVKNGQSSAITLAGGATASYFGGMTADSASFYVGASDGTVHRIDLAAGTDAAQLAVSLKQSDNSTTAIPNLVQVKNK